MFLPDDYKSPSSQNNYMKLQDGENRFRILTAPILGWEDWADKTPVRFRFADKPLTSIDPKKPVRHFWAFVVWNYATESIQILHLTQATVRKAIETLSKDVDWGAPYFYDIKIFKTGKEKETEYTVNPCPAKEIHAYIIEQFNEKPCKLEALYDNQDPFAPSVTRTPGVFSRSDVVKPTSNAQGSAFITNAQSQQIIDMINQDTNVDEALNRVLTGANATSIENIIAEKFMKVVDFLAKRLEKQKLEMNEVPF